MDQSSSSVANSSIDRQEILYILWNMKIYYCVHRILLLAPVQDQMTVYIIRVGTN
jgi:hypothetical protein